MFSEQFASFLWVWHWFFIVLIFNSLFNLLSIFRILTEILFLFLGVWFMISSLSRPRYFLLQKLSMLPVDDGLIFVCNLSSDSFSFTFVVFGISIFQYFFLKFLFFIQLLLSFLFLSQKLKFLIFIQPWNPLNINSTLGKWSYRFSQDLFYSWNSVHKEWISCFSYI